VLLSVLKFVIRTRFSRPFLILIAILATYSVGVSSLIPSHQETLILGYYGTGIIALLLAMALATGGVMVMKSDRDYLFTLPLSTRDLSLSVFFSQFLAYGISILFMFLYLAPSLSSPFLVVDLAALALVFTSLGIISPSLTTRVRISLAVTLAAWTLLAFTNFPLSPGSAFNGNVYGGTATLLVLAAVTTTLAFRGLSRIELDMMKSLVRSTSAEVKSPNSYAGKSPLGAIYSMNLSSISLAGRMNMAGSSRYVSRRVRTRWVVTATTAAALAYLVAVVYTGPPTPLITGTNTLPAAILVAILLSFLAFFLSQSAITNERLWLSLASLPPATYFRHLIISRVISLMLIVAPFAVADAALVFLGYGEALGAMAVVALVIPGSFVIEVLWSAYVAPIQVKGEDFTMPAQFNLRQLAAVLPLIPNFVLASAANFVPLLAVVGGAILIGISSVLILSGRFWGKVVTRLTENGFV
jgi:hypothetical protein